MFPSCLKALHAIVPHQDMKAVNTLCSAGLLFGRVPVPGHCVCTAGGARIRGPRTEPTPLHRRGPGWISHACSRLCADRQVRYADWSLLCGKLQPHWRVLASAGCFPALCNIRERLECSASFSRLNLDDKRVPGMDNHSDVD